MDKSYIFWGVLALVAAAFGFFGTKRRPKDPWLAKVEAERGSGSEDSGLGMAWAFGIFLVLIGCMVAAVWSGSETMTWVFGIALMGYVPIVMFLGVFHGVGRALRRGGRD